MGAEFCEEVLVELHGGSFIGTLFRVFFSQRRKGAEIFFG